jgi:hypothetical protein
MCMLYTCCVYASGGQAECKLCACQMHDVCMMNAGCVHAVWVVYRHSESMLSAWWTHAATCCVLTVYMHAEGTLSACCKHVKGMLWACCIHAEYMYADGMLCARCVHAICECMRSACYVNSVCALRWHVKWMMCACCCMLSACSVYADGTLSACCMHAEGMLSAWCVHAQYVHANGMLKACVCLLTACRVYAFW